PRDRPGRKILRITLRKMASAGGRQRGAVNKNRPVSMRPSPKCSGCLMFLAESGAVDIDVLKTAATLNGPGASIKRCDTA
ncbi:MAG: hypothetical protein ACI8UD_003898, partial [Planctomycetota bacterium]